MTTVPKSFRVWKSDDNLPQNDPNRRSDAAAAWRGVSTARSSLLRFLCVHACVLLNPSQKKKQQQTKQNTIWREHSFMILRIFFTHNSSQDELLSGNERSNRTDPILLGRLRRFLQRKTSSLLIFHTRSTTRVLTC